jgi:hypothetical protein
MAGLTEFYCGWNEPSHASQFKWLEYTFNTNIHLSVRKPIHAVRFYFLFMHEELRIFCMLSAITNTIS